MRIRLLPGGCGGETGRNYLTSFVINDVVAIDAGSIGFVGEPQEQAAIRDVLITHTHADHLASLPIFVENVYEGRPDCVTVHGNAAVLDSIRGDIFNDRIWPDFIRLSRPEAPFLALSELREEEETEIRGLRVTPVAMRHIVPTFGFIIDDGVASIVIASDTAPTERVWELANRRANLAAVFLEASFPDEMDELAKISAHLTPATFAEEMKKVERDVPYVAVHIKPRFRDQIARELEALRNPRIEIGRADTVYVFGEEA